MRLDTWRGDAYKRRLLSERARRENTKWDPCSRVLLAVAAPHCQANGSALSSLRPVLKRAVLRQRVICPAAGQPPPLFSLLPRWSQTRCFWLRQTSGKGGGANLSRVQCNQKAPGWTPTWPGASRLVWVNNTSWAACLQSPQQGQRNLTKSVWMAVRCGTDVLKWRELCHFPPVMWPWWLKSGDRGDVITRKDTRTGETVVLCCSLCVCFSLRCLTSPIAAVPGVHHGALYRCTTVTFLLLMSSERKMRLALVLIRKRRWFQRRNPHSGWRGWRGLHTCSLKQLNIL